MESASAPAIPPAVHIKNSTPHRTFVASTSFHGSRKVAPFALERAPVPKSIMQLADGGPMAPPVSSLIKRHRPWDELQDLALSIIDQTYAAALQIVGGVRDAASGIVTLSRPIDPADLDSPVLTVHASATHCCVAFNNARGDAEAFAMYTSSKGKSRPTHCLDRATISISPGTLHLARVHGLGVGGGGGQSYRSCVDLGGNRRELAIVDAIVSRLDAAIEAEQELLRKASAAGFCSLPKIAKINEVFKVLQDMRSEMDLEAVMRRRLQKRRVVEEIDGGTAAATTARDHTDATEVLSKRLRTLRVVERSRSRVDVLEQTCLSGTYDR